MNIRSDLRSAKPFLIALIFLTLFGCASPAKKPPDQKSVPDTKALSSKKEVPAPKPETDSKSDQELLDSALEFCQASQEYWEQGDLDNALDALDEAYSLILKIKDKENAEILQQKEDLRIAISRRIIEVYASRFTVANGDNSVIPLSKNVHVQRALSLFKGRQRPFFLDAYRRSGRYRPAILKALKDAGLPRELSWLPLIESGFKVRALSRARALGLWQFIASTGYKYGLKRDTWVDQRMDPTASTRAAIAYLKELHRIFGDWTTALAAYNCGEGRVLRVIESQKINYLDNFWDLYQRLPSETAFYVPQFLAVLHIIKNPKSHGFRLPETEKPVPFEKVTISKPVHMKAISQSLGISYSVLRDLNPELRRDSTPNRPHAFKVPKGKGAQLLAKVEDMPVWRPPRPRYVRHRVRRGETLSLIARRYRTSVRSIMRANGLRRSSYIKVGWSLKIPTRRQYVYAQKPRPRKRTIRIVGNSVRYRVRKGDSLWKIANRFGTTTQAIQSANGLNGRTRLRIGQVLTIPKGLTEVSKIKTKTYRVLKGDSPYSIAQKHQMSLSDLLRLNGLTPRSRIYPGQKLRVPKG